VYTGSIWRNIRISEGLCKYGNEPLGFVKSTRLAISFSRSNLVCAATSLNMIQLKSNASVHINILMVSDIIRHFLIVTNSNYFRFLHCENIRELWMRFLKLKDVLTRLSDMKYKVSFHNMSASDKWKYSSKKEMT